MHGERKPGRSTYKVEPTINYLFSNNCYCIFKYMAMQGCNLADKKHVAALVVVAKFFNDGAWCQHRNFPKEAVAPGQGGSCLPDSNILGGLN